MILPPYDGCTIDKQKVITCPHEKRHTEAYKPGTEIAGFQFPQHPVEGQRWWKYVFSRGRWQLMVGKR